MENSIKQETESFLPKQISDDIYSSITSESNDPNYEQKLGQIDQKLDELTSAIEDANNTALKVRMKPNGSGIETLKKLTLNDFKEATRKMRETLNGIFGDISSSGRKLFLENGMGYGRSVSFDVGVSGSLGNAIFLELKAHGGGGVSIMHDFLHFQTAYSTFSVCGVDIGLGIGPSIQPGVGAGASIGVSGGESWISGFSENIEESTKYPRVGVQVGPVFSAQLAVGLSLGVDVGYWQEIEEAQHNFSYLDQCLGLLASSNFGKLKAIFYSVGLNGEISTSGKLSAAMTLGTIGTRTLGLHKLVSFKNGSGKLDAISAGLNMAINIITNKDGGVMIMPSPVAFSAAATAILYGLLADVNSPTDVTGLTAITLSSSQIDLSWNSSTDDIGIAGYKIYRDGTLIGRSDVATYTDTGLTADTQYCYRVSAYDASGNESAPSIQDCETTIAIPMAPTATVTNPADGDNYNQGDTIAFTGSGSDPEDGTLAGSSLVWTSSIDGQIGTGTSFARSDLSVGSHAITLTATDIDNATGTDTINITISSPAPAGEWIKQFGTADSERSRGIAVDSSGNSYVTGSTEGDLAGTGNAGFWDVFIAKYDANGNRLWIKQFGSVYGEWGYGIAVDYSGNSYITGHTYGDLAGTGNAGIWDVFIAKYDTNGNRLWIKQFGTADWDYGYDIAVDSFGNSYVSGGTRGDLAGTGNAGSIDVFIAKYDANGNQLWIKQFGSTGADEGWDIAVDTNGNSYIAGTTWGYMGYQGYDVFIAKYDANGNQLWIKQFGTRYGEWAERFGLAVDSSGNSYLSGMTAGDIAGTGNAGGWDVFIAKYGTNGNRLWIKQFGTTAREAGHGIALDSSGNSYITGFTKGDLAGTGNAGSADVFITKYDTNGSQLWIKQFGSAGDDWGYGIAVDSSGNSYITGHTYGDLAGTGNAGSADVFIMRIYP